VIVPLYQRDASARDLGVSEGAKPQFQVEASEEPFDFPAYSRRAASELGRKQRC